MSVNKEKIITKKNTEISVALTSSPASGAQMTLEMYN
jgi:hypothetical protein